MRISCFVSLLSLASLASLTACDESRVPAPAGPAQDGGTGARADASGPAADSGATTLPDSGGPLADSGPAPDGGVSPLCNDYCLEEQFHCDGANSFFADRATCDAYCASLPLGAPGDMTGDSLHCRLYWVDQPSAMDPATNCPKAAPTSLVCD